MFSGGECWAPHRSTFGGLEGTVMGKRLRCRLGMHTWQRKLTEDNQPYRACVHCGAEDTRGEGRRPGVPEIGP